MHGHRRRIGKARKPRTAPASLVHDHGQAGGRAAQLRHLEARPRAGRMIEKAETMDFDLPAGLVAYLAELDAFIAREIKPLEEADDNIRFFDHRREWARTDFDKGGLPRPEWEELLGEARRRADRAGHYRFALPKEYGGQDEDGSNLWMAVIREHLAAKGLGCPTAFRKRP